MCKKLKTIRISNFSLRNNSQSPDYKPSQQYMLLGKLSIQTPS